MTPTPTPTAMRRMARCNDYYGTGVIRVLRPDLPLVADKASETIRTQRETRRCGCAVGHGDLRARTIGTGARKGKNIKTKEGN